MARKVHRPPIRATATPFFTLISVQSLGRNPKAHAVVQRLKRPEGFLHRSVEDIFEDLEPADLAEFEKLVRRSLSRIESNALLNIPQKYIPSAVH